MGQDSNQEELSPTVPRVNTAGSVPYPGQGVTTFCDSADRPNAVIKGKTAAGETIEVARQAAADAKTYGAKGNTVTTTATAGAASTTATIAGLTSLDIGKVISIDGAGAAGGDLITTITAVSGSTITLAAATTGSVTDAVTYIGTSDNAALTLANTGAGTSGTLLFPPGAYLITANLTLNAGTALIMRGVTFVVLSGFTLTLSGLSDVADAQRAGLKVGEGTLTTSVTGVATGTVQGLMSATDKAKLDTLQFGVATLVAGVTAAIAATVTANSRIIVTVKTATTITDTAIHAALATDRTPGAPGSFKISALKADATVNVADVSILDWILIN